ncbi:MAG: TrbI/VirB10 family protein [Stagnimonas sp.]|nr:TrbI/VirB10 family protein [Stagnimonas sp.]
MSVSLPRLEGGSPIKRKQMVLVLAAIGLLVGVVVFGLWLTDPKRKVTEASKVDPKQDVLRSYRTPGANLDPNEVWIERSETRLRGLDERNKELERELKAMRDQMQRGGNALPPPSGGDAQSSPAFDSFATPDDTASKSAPGASHGTSEPTVRRPALLPPPPPSARNAASGFPSQPLVPPAARAGSAANTAPIGPAILSVRIGAAEDKTKAPAAKPTAPVATVHNTLPTGAFARAVLLSGVDAPTGGLARTNPHPVLLRVMELAQLPNHYRSRVKECFVTAAAYGDLSAERAYMRLEKLSCVMKTGEVLDLTLKGYVTGEDGKNGFRGKVVSKQGQLIARALFAGIASGLGSSIAQSYAQVATSPLGTVQTVDPADIAKTGVATGVSNALEKVADFYIERANELYPIIEVDSARIGEIVLTDAVTLGEAFERNSHARPRAPETG